MAQRLFPMDIGHVDGAANLHAAAFPDFFLTALGTRFLRRLYRAIVEADDGFGYVIRDEVTGMVVGLAAGTAGPESSYARLFRTRVWSFGWAALPALLARPRLLPMLLRRLRAVGHPPPGGRLAYLASIAVSPDVREGGLGRVLLDGWSAEARRRLASGLYLTTDAEGNEAALAFYERCGLHLESSFESFEGRPMHRYVLEFD
jgi:ribosomal protein S18 acetylase RimI-like enzyme